MKSSVPLLLCSWLFASTTQAAQGAQEKVPAAVPQAGGQVVDVLAGGYYFRPNRITVRANTPVDLKVRKAPGMVPHNFVIDAPGAGVRVKEELGKEPRNIRVTFSAPGEYPFFCSKKPPFLKSHRERGMEGMIVVTK